MFQLCFQGILVLPVVLHIIALITKCESQDFRCLGNTTLFAQPQNSGRVDTWAVKFNKRAKIGK